MSVTRMVPDESGYEMMNNESYNDEIDLKKHFDALWHGKWMIIGFVVTFAIASTVIAINIPNQYKATALLMPSTSSSTSSLSKLAGQFGGLASLAGINLGGGASGDKTAIALELVKSWGFLDRFISEHQIEVEVFAAKAWDRSSNSLVIDSDIYDANQKKWVRGFNANAGETSRPNSLELYKSLVEKIEVSQDKKSGLIKLSVEHYSPIFAKELTDKLVVSLNKTLQDQDRQEAKTSIEYLEKQIEQTTLADMRSVFYKLIEEQTKNLMLTEVNEEYALKTIGKAMVPLEKSKPQRAVICMMGTLLGGVLGVVVVLLRKRSVS